MIPCECLAFMLKPHHPLQNTKCLFKSTIQYFQHYSLRYNAIEAKYVAMFDKAEAAVDAGDWAAVGSLANENHALCQELGVSCKELDDLVLAARAAGATGAKMSGTGRGGLMWALTPDEATQEKVFEAMSRIAPVVWKTTFSNPKGSKL
jgi:mevalonate kinase